MPKYATRNMPQTRAERREAKRGIRQDMGRRKGNVITLETAINPIPVKEIVDTRPIVYRSHMQHVYHDAIKRHQLVFGVGPAGTGKSHIAATHAAILLLERKIDKIIISRPAVESGRGLGFTPGTVEDKFEPYFRPIRKILNKRLGASHVDILIKNGKIEIAPLGFIRGDTFENAFVILDEAQNTTCHEMKTFLTRIGENTTVVVDGDPDQVDIDEPSGLVDALQRLKHLDKSTIIEFSEDDIVRSGIVKDIVRAYRRPIEG